MCICVCIYVRTHDKTKCEITLCNIYSMVGRSIADIYDQGVILIEVRRAKVNMLAEVEYIGYGPPYRTIYNILYGECATDEPF